jgi:hypothetical protein
MRPFMKILGTRPRRNSIPFLLPAILALLIAQMQTASAAVTGTVVDNAGNPVAAARVLISHAAPANVRISPRPQRSLDHQPQQ